MVLALLAPTLIAPPVFAQSVLTRDNGAKVSDNQNSQTAGATGPTLLQDVQLIQKLQRFDRERIPERVVHARGTGVKGEFTATADLSNLTKAKVFSAGEKTPVFVRFSSVVHGNHSPETLRDRTASPPSSTPAKATGIWSATTSPPSSFAMRSSSPTWSTRSSRIRAPTWTMIRVVSISSRTCPNPPAR